MCRTVFLFSIHFLHHQCNVFYTDACAGMSGSRGNFIFAGNDEHIISNFGRKNHRGTAIRIFLDIGKNVIDDAAHIFHMDADLGFFRKKFAGLYLKTILRQIQVQFRQIIPQCIFCRFPGL